MEKILRKYSNEAKEQTLFYVFKHGDNISMSDSFIPSANSTNLASIFRNYDTWIQNYSIPGIS
jgi:hypothetical protein